MKESDLDFDMFDAEKFYVEHNIIHGTIWKMLNGIPGDWAFSGYHVFTHDGIENHNVIFNDMDDEDRCFSIEWDNKYYPFPNKAHIEIAID